MSRRSGLGPSDLLFLIRCFACCRGLALRYPCMPGPRRRTCHHACAFLPTGKERCVRACRGVGHCPTMATGDGGTGRCFARPIHQRAGAGPTTAGLKWCQPVVRRLYQAIRTGLCSDPVRSDAPDCVGSKRPRTGLLTPATRHRFSISITDA
jgi:hypothetical protein